MKISGTNLLLATVCVVAFIGMLIIALAPYIFDDYQCSTCCETEANNRNNALDLADKSAFSSTNSDAEYSWVTAGEVGEIEGVNIGVTTDSKYLTVSVVVDGSAIPSEVDALHLVLALVECTDSSGGRVRIAGEAYDQVMLEDVKPDQTHYLEWQVPIEEDGTFRLDDMFDHCESFMVSVSGREITESSEFTVWAPTNSVGYYGLCGKDVS
jgi:hypothetical protein